jgi:hypothetical protein
MLSRVDRLVFDVAVAVLLFVGVSASVSEWFDALYSKIAFWALIVGVPIGALVFWVKGLDLGLTREIQNSWSQNRVAVDKLNALHAAHPEVAKELSARMAEEKARRAAGQQVVPPTGV